MIIELRDAQGVLLSSVLVDQIKALWPDAWEVDACDYTYKIERTHDDLRLMPGGRFSRRPQYKVTVKEFPGLIFLGTHHSVLMDEATHTISEMIDYARDADERFPPAGSDGNYPRKIHSGE